MEALKLERLPDLGDSHPEHPDYECIGKACEMRKPVTGTATWRNLRRWPAVEDIVQEFIIPRSDGNELGSEKSEAARIDFSSPAPPVFQYMTSTSADGKQLVGLGGWQEMEQWGCENDACFHHTKKAAQEMGLNETETLKLLVGALLHKVHHLDALLVHHFKRNPAPFNFHESIDWKEELRAKFDRMKHIQEIRNHRKN